VRAKGTTLAIDLGTPAEAAAVAAQGPWRGLVGSAVARSVWWTFSSAYGDGEIEAAMRAIFESLAWLDAHPGKQPPAWEDLEEAPAAGREVHVRRASASEVDALLPRIVALEARVYEPARRDPPERLRLAFDDPDGIAILAEAAGELVGSAVAAPLERVSDVAGPDRDPARGRNDTLYAIALTVDPSLQSEGIGRRLKQAQLAAARDAKKRDGTPRFAWVAGRNRLDHAAAAMRVIDSFGAFTAFVLDNQYGGASQARYYRQPLRAMAAPVAPASPGLARLDGGGGLVGAAIDPLPLDRYVTPAAVRAIEHLAALAPDLPHLVLSPGRDEMVESIVRVLRRHRPKGTRMISLAGAYLGETMRSARAASEGGEWPRAPHPADGEGASESALRDAIAQAGAESILAIAIEAVEERTGRAVPATFAARLAAIRKDTGVPIVVVETAAMAKRASFASESWPQFLPDVLAWWTGAQLGVAHVSKALYAGPPIDRATASDELSLLLVHDRLTHT
jgi:GNAT superfamily N-acetyltransferase